jgi:chemotaxis protein MotB
VGIKREEEEPFSAPPWIVTFSDMIGLLTSFFIMLLTYSTKSNADFQKLAGALQGEFGIIADPKNNDFQSLTPPKDLLSPKNRDDGLRQEHPELVKPRDEAKVMVRKPTVGERVQMEKMNDGMRIKLVTQTTFAPGSTRLTDDDREVLKEVADLLRLTQHHFVVVGNAWDEGEAARTPADLVTLSQRRALEVATFLESAGRLGRDRVGIGGVGDAQPLEISHAPDVAEMNRRVEIILYPER